MGDDIHIARRFSSRCQNKLRPIFLTGQRDHKTIMETLEWVRENAETAKARAISRAAALAIEEFNIPGLYPRGERALLSLNKLVTQYTDGLNEIDDEDGRDQLCFAKAGSAEIDAFNEAKAVLASVMHFAGEESEISALSKLSGFAPFANEAGSKDLDNFDIIMPVITDETLRSARMQGKTVSLSYAADAIPLQDALAQRLQSGLVAICQTLVSAAVQSPKDRQGGAAHLALTARQQQATFDILISCEGPCPAPGIFDGPEVQALTQEFGAKFHIHGHQDLTFAEVTGLPMWDSPQDVDGFDPIEPRTSLRRPA